MIQILLIRQLFKRVFTSLLNQSDAGNNLLTAPAKLKISSVLSSLSLLCL